MNEENKINLKFVMANNPQLFKVIKFSIGDPKHDKILEVIKSYHNTGNRCFHGEYFDRYYWGLFEIFNHIIIRHISVLPDFQRQKVGTLLLDNIKGCYVGYTIIIETDTESLDFYLKNAIHFKVNMEI